MLTGSGWYTDGSLAGFVDGTLRFMNLEIGENPYETGENEEQEEVQVEEYQINSAPNDFNLLTIFSFIESGAIKIPGFQRNYVWDQKRASKLIESLIVGLPIPQIFLYESGRNEFLVIDGQQRLMTIYYFYKQRFPKKLGRAELRQIFNVQGSIPAETLHDDKYFTNFNLQLPKLTTERPNRFAGLNYMTLGEYKTQFDLRTIRNVIIKQLVPSDDDSSIYEMFNRLNTGGINLTPQEIRSSLFHSPFFDLLFEMNLDPRWRRIIGAVEPDIHMRDTEVLLRAIAMSSEGDNYRASMASFLNRFSKTAKSMTNAQLLETRSKFERFFELAKDVPEDAFKTRTGKLSVTLFESVFAAVGCNADLTAQALDPAGISELRENSDFRKVTDSSSGDTANVRERLRLASSIQLLKIRPNEQP